jgi:hypothetical protein
MGLLVQIRHVRCRDVHNADDIIATIVIAGNDICEILLHNVAILANEGNRNQGIYCDSDRMCSPDDLNVLMFVMIPYCPYSNQEERGVSEKERHSKKHTWNDDENQR